MTVSSAIRAIADPLQRELPERVRGPGRVEQVAGQQRIQVEPVERRAVPSEHERRRLQVVAHLPDRGVPRGRASRANALSGSRSVPSPPSARCPAVHSGRDGGRPRSRSLRPRRAWRARNRSATRCRRDRRGPWHRPGSRDPPSCERWRSPLNGGRGRRVVGEERPEPERGKEVQAALARRTVVPQRGPVERHRDVHPDAHQVAAVERFVGMLLERRTVAGRRDRTDVGQQGVERPVGRDEARAPSRQSRGPP